MQHCLYINSCIVIVRQSPKTLEILRIRKKGKWAYFADLVKLSNSSEISYFCFTIPFAEWNDFLNGMLLTTIRRMKVHKAIDIPLNYSFS